MVDRRIVGALVGWRRTSSRNGIVISFQYMTPEAAAHDRALDRVAFALNDRQLRSLARDLQRAARERGIRLWATPKWWKLLLGSLRERPTGD